MFLFRLQSAVFFSFLVRVMFFVGAIFGLTTVLWKRLTVVFFGLVVWFSLHLASHCWQEKSFSNRSLALFLMLNKDLSFWVPFKTRLAWKSCQFRLWSSIFPWVILTLRRELISADFNLVSFLFSANHWNLWVEILLPQISCWLLVTGRFAVSITLAPSVLCFTGTLGCVFIFPAFPSLLQLWVTRVTTVVLNCLVVSSWGLS